MSTVNAFETTPGSEPSPLQERLTTQAGGSNLGALQEGVGDELVAMVPTMAAEAIDDRIEALERDWQQKRVRFEDLDVGVEITSENSQTNGMQTTSVLTVSDPQVSPSSSEEDEHTFGLPDADVDFLDACYVQFLSLRAQLIHPVSMMFVTDFQAREVLLRMQLMHFQGSVKDQKWLILFSTNMKRHLESNFDAFTFSSLSLAAVAEVDLQAQALHRLGTTVQVLGTTVQVLVHLRHACVHKAAGDHMVAGAIRDLKANRLRC
eukprot:3169014-Amphidinium_carterae.2